jgi:signal peptidase I
MGKLDTGPIFADIGDRVAALLGGDLDEAYLYAEMEEGMYGASIFKDIGDRILYRDPDDYLIDHIEKAWEAEAVGSRWQILEYEVSKGRFKVELTYPTDIDPDESSLDRRARALKRRYGNKPIDYSNP